MNVSAIANVAITQRHEYYANISMNVFVIANVVTMQLRRCYAGIAMDVFVIVNVMITQRCKRCTYDSPGLTRDEPTPGKRSQGDSTP